MGVSILSHSSLESFRWVRSMLLNYVVLGSVVLLLCCCCWIVVLLLLDCCVVVVGLTGIDYVEFNFSKGFLKKNI